MAQGKKGTGNPDRPFLNIRISPDEKLDLERYIAEDQMLSRMEKGSAIEYLLNLGRRAYETHIAGAISNAESIAVNGNIAPNPKDKKKEA